MSSWSNFCLINPVLSLGLLQLPWMPRRPIERVEPRKKALLIGINYNNDLRGPQEDVKRMENLLINRFGYSEDGIVVLYDRPDCPQELQPTRENIMRQLKSFYNGQRPGDHHFFMYAGHTYQQECKDGSEADHLDELILPLDAYQVQDKKVFPDKAIIDDDLKRYLVEPLFYGSRLVAVFDSCHSETLLDLPHSKCNRVCSFKSPVRRTVRRAMEVCRNVFVSDNAEGLNDICMGYCLRPKSSNQPVVCISACKDSQQTFEDSKGKSMASIIIDLLENNPRMSLKKLMREISSGLNLLSKGAEEESLNYQNKLQHHNETTGRHKSPSPSQNIKYLTEPQISSLHPLRMKSLFQP